jgi:hypothetical protein
VKRIIDVSIVNQAFEKAEWASGAEKAMVYRQGSKSDGTPHDLRAKRTAFSELPKSCPAASLPETVNFQHPSGAFPSAFDFAFQVQMMQCPIKKQGGGSLTLPGGNKCINENKIDNTYQSCQGGDYKTVRVYLDYHVEQEYINRREIAYNLNVGLYSGIPSISNPTDFKSYTSKGEKNAAVELSLVNSTKGQVIQPGQPFDLVTEVDGGISQHMALQQRMAIVAIDMVQCDPNSKDGCPHGHIEGKCGTKVDGSDATVAAHALKDVFLYDGGTQIGTQAPTTSKLKTKLKGTPWYSALKLELSKSVQGDFEVCWGTKTFDMPNGLPKNSLKNAISLWCIEDNLETSTIWSGVEKVTEFLQEVTDNTCNKEHALYTCNPGTNKWCSKGLDVAEFHKLNPDTRGCLGTNLDLLLSEQTTHKTNFVYGPRFIQIVDEYALQKKNIAGNGFITYGDLGEGHHDCRSISPITGTNDYQASAHWNKTECSRLSRLVTTNFDMLPKIMGLHRMSDSLPVSVGPYEDIAKASRRQQCSPLSKSTVLTENDDGHAFLTKRFSRNSISVGSSFSLPCVARKAFMVSVLTDTRNDAVCRRAEIKCDANVLKIKGVSHVNSHAGIPDEDDWYTLYKHVSGCNHLSRGSADTRCAPKITKESGEPVPYTPALLEGMEHDVCGSRQSLQHVENGKGLKFPHGMVELFEYDHPDEIYALTTKRGSLLYVNPKQKHGAAQDDWDWVSCGTANSDIVCDVASTLEAPRFESIHQFTPNGRKTPSGGRRLLESSPSDGRQLLTLRTSGSDNSVKEHRLVLPLGFNSRREGSSDVQLVHTGSIAAGAFIEETCKTRIDNSVLECNKQDSYTYKANYDQLKCSANTGGTCTHSYCCTQLGHVNLYNTWNYYSNDVCSDLDNPASHLMITFIISFCLAIFLTLLIMMNIAFIWIMRNFYPNSVFIRNHDQSTNLNWRVISMVVIIMLQLCALTMGAIGHRDDNWIDVCDFSDTVGWTIWLPILNIMVIFMRLLSVIGGLGACGITITIETAESIVPVGRIVLAMRNAFSSATQSSNRGTTRSTTTRTGATKKAPTTKPRKSDSTRTKNVQNLV